MKKLGLPSDHPDAGRDLRAVERDGNTIYLSGRGRAQGGKHIIGLVGKAGRRADHSTQAVGLGRCGANRPRQPRQGRGAEGARNVRAVRDSRPAEGIMGPTVVAVWASAGACALGRRMARSVGSGRDEAVSGWRVGFKSIVILKEFFLSRRGAPCGIAFSRRNGIVVRGGRAHGTPLAAARHAPESGRCPSGFEAFRENPPSGESATARKRRRVATWRERLGAMVRDASLMRRSST